MKPGYVYFAGYGNKLKIGKSENPQKRVKSLNTASPSDIQLYVAIATADMDELERQLHKHFADSRLKGEWFTITPELQYLVMGLMGVASPIEMNIGWFLGTFKYLEADKALKERPSLLRRIGSLELYQQALWAVDYAVRSLGLHSYPAFQMRKAEAEAVIAKLPEGEVPLFVRNVDGTLKLEDAQSESDAA